MCANHIPHVLFISYFKYVVPSLRKKTGDTNYKFIKTNKIFEISVLS